MDKQCANIFSTHATVYGSHSAMFAFYWKREYFFFMCILNLVFKFDLCVFFSPPPKVFPKTVFPNTCFVFPIFIGGEKFFLPLLLFIGGVVSILYRVDLFYVPLLLYFLFSFIAYVYSLLSCLCQYVIKRGRSRWNVEILFVLFMGRYFDSLW